MNKRTFLVIALLFATFQARASEVSAATAAPTAFARIKAFFAASAEATEALVPAAGVAADAIKKTVAPAAEKIVAATPTILSRLQGIGSSIIAAPGAAWTSFTNEPIISGSTGFVGTAASKTYGALVTTKDAVVNGVVYTGSSIAATPSATLAFVKANPITLTAAALLAVGGYVVYQKNAKKTAKN